MSRQNANAQVYDEEYEMMEENPQRAKRNPYLVDYAQQRGYQERNKARYINANLAGAAISRLSAQPQAPEVIRRPSQSGEYAGTRRPPRSGEYAGTRRPPQSGEYTETRRPQRSKEYMETRRPQRSKEYTETRRPQRSGEYTATRRPQRSGESTGTRRSARYRRKKYLFMQRVTISLWVLCIVLLGTFFAVRSHQASAAANDKKDAILNDAEPKGNEPVTEPVGTLVQGIPAEKFAKHPEWNENFLTPNEYSRPGDLLEADNVTNIFVHYTANPGTSAAQNRSYFEQQKDLHQSSVSSHFIIGYEGEILQCVPLDEIAYAVQTRNYDSISIECCFLEKDGSFEQETYDSLVELLAWLIDVYDLNSEDILRHYDCGGKKCPLYYTNNPEEWVQLKKDVDNYK